MTVVKKSKLIRSYHDIKNHTELGNTRPEELIQKLFGKACDLIEACLKDLDSAEENNFQQSALHALQIVLSLRFVLDTDSENPQAITFYETYTSIAASLLRAKNSRDRDSLIKIKTAMDELSTAWAFIARAND